MTALVPPTDAASAAAPIIAAVLPAPSKVGARLEAFDYSGKWITTEPEMDKMRAADIKRVRELDDPKRVLLIDNLYNIY